VIGLGLTYPVMAGQEWLNWRNPSRDWMGINGLEYVDSTTQSYNEPGEYDAINWLWDNNKQDDVMLSAAGCAWQTQIGRPAGATGIPSILGWTDHEEQWHLSDSNIVAETTQRVTDVTTMFNAPPSTDLLDKYGVTLIFIGPVETTGNTGQTSSAGCAPGPFQGASNPDYPGAGWTEVYNAEGVRIYRRDGS
ncbi:MAG TPA: hypothetical protein VFQ54_05985, partial [Thermomicrobiales bacterium]|nr:hypothetical protein [Thermomicrobiales bacterium]